MRYTTKTNAINGLSKRPVYFHFYMEGEKQKELFIQDVLTNLVLITIYVLNIIIN